MLKDFGRIEKYLNYLLKNSNYNLLSALDTFANTLSSASSPGSFPLLSSPLNGSASKRLFLYLRWMIRSDAIDPGGWTIFSPSELLVPCDTHLHRIALNLGLTSHNSPSLKTVQEITTNFKRISPHDPVKYDFVLTRFGIRTGLPKTYLYSSVK